MKLLAQFHRVRLAQTRYWLPYEQQICERLLVDDRLADLHPIIENQITHLHIAYRSSDLGELAATYSYDGCVRFWDVCDEFTLCKISASNGTGEVFFGGGMLAQILIRPNDCVNNPKKFHLQEISLNEIVIPTPAPLPPSTSWVAELEQSGVLVRHAGPANQQSEVPDRYLHEQYVELFTQCSAASARINGELFSFLPPGDLSVVEDHEIGLWVPILDLREFGGLGITHCNKSPKISFVDRTVVWSEENIPSAIKRVRYEMST